RLGIPLDLAWGLRRQARRGLAELPPRRRDRRPRPLHGRALHRRLLRRPLRARIQLPPALARAAQRAPPRRRAPLSSQPRLQPAARPRAPSPPPARRGTLK